jgi:hypothetical protein
MLKIGLPASNASVVLSRRPALPGANSRSATDQFILARGQRPTCAVVPEGVNAAGRIRTSVYAVPIEATAAALPPYQNRIPERLIPMAWAAPQATINAPNIATEMDVCTALVHDNGMISAR